MEEQLPASPQVTPQVSIPEVHPVQKKSNIFIILIMGFLIFLLVGSLFSIKLLGNQSKKPTAEAIPTATPTQATREMPTATITLAPLAISPIPLPILSIPNDWKTYSDPNNQFSFKYPPTWTVKKGFNFQGDVGVFDPSQTKEWEENGGGTLSWPLHYVDIVSVNTSSHSAIEYAENYPLFYHRQLSDENPVIYKNGTMELVMYDQEGESAVRSRELTITYGGVLTWIETTSTIQGLEPATDESRIITSLNTNPYHLPSDTVACNDVPPNICPTGYTCDGRRQNFAPFGLCHKDL